MAEQEKEKGNEAFRAGDYEEALEYYNTSIKMNSNITTYNNRAMAYIKLQRYEDALSDCNLVLSVEYTNIKALLRRAVALEHLEKSSQALADYEAALILEPTNAVAIAGVKKLRKPCSSRKVRMTIKEEQTEDSNKISRSREIEEKRNYIAQFGSKLNLASNICYCDKAPGPSQNLRPRPHIKAEYCFEYDNKEATSKNAVSKKSKGDQKVAKMGTELTKNLVSNINNCSSNISKLSQEKSNSASKQKSIFSYTRPPQQTSSVIIEELPSEASNSNCVNTKAKSNETVSKKSKSNAKATSKCKASDIEQTKTSNVKNVNNFNLNEKRITISSPRKVQVADKYKNKTSKTEKYVPKDFQKIDNGYEFMRIWRSLKNDADLQVYAQLLRSLDVDKLHSVLGNELDGSMFSIIVRCLERHFCTANDTELLNNFLKSFSQVKRFSIVNMFMNTEDKRAIKNIISFLEEHGTSGVSSLRQIYCV